MKNSIGWNRRAFLKGVAGVAVGASPVRARWSGNARYSPAFGRTFVAERSVSFGFSLYGMKSLAPGEALGACGEIGYDGVELALMPGWPTEPGKVGAAGRRELRRQMDGLGLELAGLMENVHAVCDDATHRANLERLRVAADFGHGVMPGPKRGEGGDEGGRASGETAASQGGEVVVETILGGRPDQWEEVKGQMAARLEDWARVAEAGDMTIAIKPHVGGALHTPEGAQWLRRRVDSPRIKLAYDYSHFELRGFALDQTIATMIRDTVFIHVKDSAGDAENVRFLLPGDGESDYARYVRLLGAAEYGGPVVVEVSGQIHNRPGYDAAAAARRSYANVAPVFEAAGLRRRARG